MNICLKVVMYTLVTGITSQQNLSGMHSLQAFSQHTQSFNNQYFPTETMTKNPSRYHAIERGDSPLSQAAGHGNYNETYFILESSPQIINGLSDTTKTALHWAAGNGHLRTTQLLIDKKVNPFVIDDCGAMALDWATTYQDIYFNLLSFMQHLEEQTPLLTASRQGDLARLQTIIYAEPKEQHGCQSQWNTALCLAAKYGHVQCVQLILDTGYASAESPDSYYNLPLCLAAFYNQVDVINAIINFYRTYNYNIDNLINGFDLYGRTPLMYAAVNESVEAVATLLNYGANRNAISPAPSTLSQVKNALFYARYRERSHCPGKNIHKRFGAFQRIVALLTTPPNNAALIAMQ